MRHQFFHRNSDPGSLGPHAAPLTRRMPTRARPRHSWGGWSSCRKGILSYKMQSQFKVEHLQTLVQREWNCKNPKWLQTQTTSRHGNTRAHRKSGKRQPSRSTTNPFWHTNTHTHSVHLGLNWCPFSPSVWVCLLILVSVAYACALVRETNVCERGWRRAPSVKTLSQADQYYSHNPSPAVPSPCHVLVFHFILTSITHPSFPPLSSL